MRGHIIWGKIELDKSQSNSASASQSNVDKSNSASNTGKGKGPATEAAISSANDEALRKRNIAPEDVTQLSGNSSSSTIAGKQPAPPQAGGRRKPPPEDTAGAGESQDESSDDSETEREKQMQIEQQRAAMGVLRDVDEETLKKTVPLNSKGELTSIGSVEHEAGTCKICMFAFSKLGCNNGIYCNFCHFPHKRSKRKNKLRPSKGKRDRYRKLVSALTSQITNGPESFDVNTLELPPSIAANEPMKARLMAKLAPHIEQAQQARKKVAEEEHDREKNAPSSCSKDETIIPI